jgi:hypothetical protein
MIKTENKFETFVSSNKEKSNKITVNVPKPKWLKIKRTATALLVSSLIFSGGYWVYTESNDPDQIEYSQEWDEYNDMIDQIEIEYGKNAHSKISLAFADKDISMIMFVLQKEYDISETKAFVYCQRKLGYKGDNPLLNRDPEVIERVKKDVENGNYPFFNSDKIVKTKN